MKRFWTAVEIVCGVLLVICVAVAAGDAMNRKRTMREEIRSAPILTEDVTQEREIFEYFIPLLDQNPQTAGLIGIEDRTMYVCRADDNRYYMDHRFDGVSDDAGMIFLDCRCSIGPRSDNLILYGHNRRDGSRFGTLKRYLNPEYLLNHPVIRFATLYEVHDYMPLAVILTTADEMKDRFDWAKVDFRDDTEYEAFLDEARRRSALKLSLEVAPDTPLLTLVTCSGDGDDGRLVIVCAQKNSMDPN